MLVRPEVMTNDIVVSCSGLGIWTVPGHFGQILVEPVGTPVGRLPNSRQLVPDPL